jgi:hypothetical protein
MPRYQCLACKNRFYSAASPADLFSGDVCPECGCLTEQVDDFAGAEPIAAGAARVVAASAVASTAERFGHLIARREVVRAQVRLAAERWEDDGGIVVTAVEGGGAEPV